MSRDTIYKKKIDFLKSIGSDKVKHSGGTLLEHLIGTSEELKKLGAPEYLQDAGLFPSVYGTVYFMPDDGLIENRQVVKVKLLNFIDFIYLISGQT